jgi:hypothetical protein
MIVLKYQNIYQAQIKERKGMDKYNNIKNLCGFRYSCKRESHPPKRTAFWKCCSRIT